VASHGQRVAVLQQLRLVFPVQLSSAALRMLGEACHELEILVLHTRCNHELESVL
jgi:hypothetical protein